MFFTIILSIFFIFIISINASYLGKKLDLVDHPSIKKIHKLSVPLLGGPIIFAVLLFFLFSHLFYSITLKYHYFYILLFFILGLIDDKINLNSYYKILSIIIFSIILIYLDESFLIHKIFFDISGNEYYFGNLKIPVTIICILLLYIAMNMSDGINCLLISFSITAIISLNIFIFGLFLDVIDKSILVTLVPLAYFNFKNKIFLGNSGASLLGGYFVYKLISVNYFSQVDVFQIISIFLIMGVDMVRIVITRLINRKNPFTRDLNHFHHMLLKKTNNFFTIIIYLLMSFGPLYLSLIFDTTILNFILIPFIFYFYIVKQFT